MKLNKLLEKQLRKYFPGELYEQDAVKQFINSVNDSYNAYEKDIELSDHAFKITEEEYRDLNHKLKEEIDLKGTLINKLKEAVSDIGETTLMESDDEHEILNIASYLKKQIIRQREADKKIQDQKQFYENILNRIPADIAVFDDHHRYLFVNPLAIGNVQLREWIIGKNDIEYCAYKNRPASVAEVRRQRFQDAVSSRQQVEWEENSTGPDGRAIINLRKMFPVFNEEGKLEIVIGYGIDITERKRIEEQIRLSEARYKGIFDNSLALICTHDLNGVLLEINKASVDTFEYSREELLGSSLQKLIPAEKQAEFITGYLNVIKEHGKAEGIMVALNKQGKKIYLLYHNYLVSNDSEQPYVIGFSQDITARFDAERALKKSEEKYRGIIANMNLGLMETDKNQSIIYTNHSFCEMSGYDSEELTGHSADEIFWRDDSSVSNKEVMKRREEGKSDAYELKTRNKNGEIKWWLISGAPSFDQKGKFFGSIGIYLDITMQKTLEHELRKAKSDAELSAQAKEIFLANISHEIRTPMNAILGIGSLLNKTHLGTQQKFYLNIINNAANNLLVIINDLLDFSKIEAGKLALEHIGFDLDASIRNAMQILNHKAEEKGLLLSCASAKGIAPVLIGDPYRLNQVLMNFMSNSLKFTDRGKVEVTCKLLSEDTESQLITFNITDTGIGMSKEFMSNLFDKFSQEDESITRKFGGTGLGMSISKQLIHLMGGSINVESTKNEGTTISFTIRFPIGTSDDLPEKQFNTIDAMVLKGKRLLLVEDNDMNRLLATTILKQYGAEIDEADNGSVAIDMIKRNLYDLVLMDVQMPVKDGIEATRYIRSNIDSGIPIIALTANAYRKEEERCLNAGMNDFISKPFEENKIVQVVAQWLGRETKRLIPLSSANGESGAAGKKLYDLEKITAISRGNEAFVDKMVNTFIENIPKMVEEMRVAYENNDWKTISKLTPQIKPSLLSMNISSVEDDIKFLEEFKTRNPDKEGILNHLDHISEIISEVVRQLLTRH